MKIFLIYPNCKFSEFSKLKIFGIVRHSTLLAILRILIFALWYESILSIFASSLRKLCFREKNRDIIEVNRDSKWSKTANCPTTIIHKRLEISSWNLLHQSSNHNPLIVTIFIQIDAQSEMLWDSQWSDCDNLPLVTTRGNCPTIFQY